MGCERDPDEQLKAHTCTQRPHGTLGLRVTGWWAIQHSSMPCQAAVTMSAAAREADTRFLLRPVAAWARAKWRGQVQQERP